MFPVVTFEVTVKTKSVNNKRIFEEVDNLVMETLRIDPLRLKTVEGHDQAIILLEDVLDEFAQLEPKLDQITVISDQRNNSHGDREAGTVRVVVRYQQKDCFNITELEYTVAF